MPKFLVTDEDNRLIAASGDGPSLLKSYGNGWDSGTAFMKAAEATEQSKPATEPDERTPHFGAHHAELAASTEEGDEDHDDVQAAAGHMRAGDEEGMRNHLRKVDPDTRDHCLDHIHPDHWEGLGFRPVDEEGAKAAFGKKFGPGEGGEDPADAKGGESTAAGPEPKRKGEEQDLAKALLFTNDPAALAAATKAA